MREAIRFTLFVVVIFALISGTHKWPLYGFIGIFVIILAIGLYDINQKKHTILRNFPVIGHMRYLLEMISPEIHQYFIENDTDGKPINRNQRTSKITEFVAHAYLGMSNSHGYEIQVNDSGDAVRVRDTHSNDITEWLELTEDDTEDGAMFNCPWDNNDYRIGEFMKY